MVEVKQIFDEINEALKEDSNRVKGVKAVYEFHFLDDESAVYQLVLDGENSYAAEGSDKTPECTLTMAADDFRDMANGQLNGTKAFMSGRLKIKGNMGLALKLQDILASYNKSKN